MTAKALVDTGPLLALVDESDRWHRACAESLQAFRLPLVTSAAVLTELFHLLGDSRHQRGAAWTFVRSGAVRVLPIDEFDLPELEALMEKYHDRPMDFADATLVRLANRESLTTIFTTDHDDFETYRLAGRRRFRIFPHRQPSLRG